MNKETYSELEDFVYSTLFKEGNNDIEIVKIELYSSKNNKEVFEYHWKDKMEKVIL